MAKLTLSDMMNGLNDLTVDELHQLNQQLIAISRSKQRVQRAVAASGAVGKFQIGDVIRFYKEGRGRNAGWNYFKYTGLNRNRDCMQGPSCNADGTAHQFPVKWTVTLTQPTLEVMFRNGVKVSK